MQTAGSSGRLTASALGMTSWEVRNYTSYTLILIVVGDLFLDVGDGVLAVLLHVIARNVDAGHGRDPDFLQDHVGVAVLRSYLPHLGIIENRQPPFVQQPEHPSARGGHIHGGEISMDVQMSGGNIVLLMKFSPLGGHQFLHDKAGARS